MFKVTFSINIIGNQQKQQQKWQNSLFFFVRSSGDFQNSDDVASCWTNSMCDFFFFFGTFRILPRGGYDRERGLKGWMTRRWEFFNSLQSTTLGWEGERKWIPTLWFQRYFNDYISNCTVAVVGRDRKKKKKVVIDVFKLSELIMEKFWPTMKWWLASDD